ncbi:hypothetical protein EDD17DRAFT_1006704 [Pisolithus thermaeus]|nr:hypothetical protein EDD17DRAFT_1006704 [Pisolithus thermaeus]
MYLHLRMDAMRMFKFMTNTCGTCLSLLLCYGRSVGRPTPLLTDHHRWSSLVLHQIPRINKKQRMHHLCCADSPIGHPSSVSISTVISVAPWAGLTGLYDAAELPLYVTVSGFRTEPKWQSKPSTTHCQRVRMISRYWQNSRCLANSS